MNLTVKDSAFIFEEYGETVTKPFCKSPKENFQLYFKARFEILQRTGRLTTPLSLLNLKQLSQNLVTCEIGP